MADSNHLRTAYTPWMQPGASRRTLAAGIAILSVASTLIGCGQHGFAGKGSVTVNGKPLDSGTITLKSTAKPGQSHGAIIEDGVFFLGETTGLSSGEYVVIVEGLQRTGRIVKDPQRGELPEMAVLDFVNLPQTITLSPENAHDIQLNLTTRK